VRGLVGLRHGANFQGIISAPASYQRVVLPLKWSVHLIFFITATLNFQFLSPKTSLPSGRDCCEFPLPLFVFFLS